jgi:hypothetical protein
MGLTFALGAYPDQREYLLWLWERAMSQQTHYDPSWDKGNEKLWDKKYRQWERRDWMDWLGTILTFPFEVVRKEDMSENPFEAIDRTQPFSVGHRMTALELVDEDDAYGVIVKVREGRETAYLPLCDLEVTSRKDSNFWPVREYVVWYANR